MTTPRPGRASTPRGADVQLTLWTYEGPPHVGAMRVATAMQDVHYVLHAPQGDTYADLLFTMIERLPKRPPVTYTTFQARDLGGDTAELVQACRPRRLRPFQAEGDDGGCLMHGGADPGRPGRARQGARSADPGGRARTAVVPAQGKLGSLGNLLPDGACVGRAESACKGRHPPARPVGQRPRCNLLGPTALGFRHRDDVREITQLLDRMGIDVQRLRRWAHRPTTSPTSAKPISTW